jgi:hypothetical protein
MKKLGTFESDPPSVEGSGGVSAEGDTALLFLPVMALDGGCVVDGLPWAWVTVVRGCERCVRTSGAGTVVAVDSPVEVVGGGGVAVVLVLVGAGSTAGGAGTFVVVVAAAGAVASAVGAVEVTSASAASTGASMASATSSGSRSAVGDGRVLMVSCRAGS